MLGHYTARVSNGRYVADAVITQLDRSGFIPQSASGFLMCVFLYMCFLQQRGILGEVVLTT